MSDKHNDVRFGRPVRLRIAPLTFSRGERESAVIFTNAPLEKGTEWLDDDAFPGITGWRRQHALASMRACLGVLTFAAAGYLALDDMEALQAVIGGTPGHLQPYLGWYRALELARLK